MVDCGLKYGGPGLIHVPLWMIVNLQFHNAAEPQPQWGLTTEATVRQSRNQMQILRYAALRSE